MGKQAEFRQRFIQKAETRNSRLILALDEPLLEKVRSVTHLAGPHLAAIKVHPEYPYIWKSRVTDLKHSSLFTGYSIADAKLADIDSTNAWKTKHILSHGYDAIICHGFPGQPAVEAIVNVANELEKGVFLLTAMTSKGHMFDPRRIEALASMARELGVAGVIAPGNQYDILRRVRRLIGPELLILSPGIGAQGGDAEKAFIAGADFAIVGRQILEATNAANTAEEIRNVINNALGTKVRMTGAVVQKEEPLSKYDELFSILVEKEVMRFGKFTLKSGRPSIYFFNAGRIDDGKSISAVAEAYADTIHENKLHEQFDVLFGPAYKGIPIATYVAQALWTKYGVNMRAVYDRKEAKELLLFSSDTTRDALVQQLAAHSIPLPAGDVIESILELKEKEKLRMTLNKISYTIKMENNKLNVYKVYGDPDEKEFVGDVRKGDRVLILDDVITTGGTKHGVVDKLNSLKLDLKINGLLILFDREEIDLERRDPLKELEDKGIKTWTVLKAREVFGYMKGKEFVGKVLITDELFGEFQTHQEEFGRKVKNTGKWQSDDELRGAIPLADIADGSF